MVLLESAGRCLIISLVLVVCLAVVVAFVQDAALVSSIKVRGCVHERGVILMASRGGTVRSDLPSLMLTIEMICLVLLCLLLRLLAIEEGLLGLSHTLLSATFSHLSCHSLAATTTASLRVDILVAVLATLQKLLPEVWRSRICRSICFNS